jgi:CXXC-20-CXXC protein
MVIKTKLTKRMNNFKCPNCNNKIPFNEVFQFKKGHQTVCNHCNTTLKPKKIKSWNWGFLIGFLAVVIPAKLYLNYHKNFLIAASIGIVFGAIAILLIAYYTYKTTEFEEV